MRESVRVATTLRCFMRAIILSLSIAVPAACARSPGVVVLAFSHGGDAGADGLRADAAATSALATRGVAVEHLDLDGGVQNPHEDEGTDDGRAVAKAANLATSLAGRHDVLGVVVGPTRAIADAVPWRRLPMRVVAVAPLVRDIPCACDTEAELRKHDAGVIIESSDGLTWTDPHGRVFDQLRDVVADRAAFDVVSRRGFRYRAPEQSKAALLVYPGAIDRRDFDAGATRLVPLGTPESGIEQMAKTAAAMVLHVLAGRRGMRDATR